MADPRGCFDAWAEGKDDLQRSSLLEGLIDLAERPLTELPGIRSTGRSPMSRWMLIASTVVVIHVYESQGWFDLVDLRDL